MANRLRYTYAVVRPSSALEHVLSDVRGVANASVALVRSTTVAAAVSSVPEEEFSEQALKDRLEDLDWLETVARAHHSVVEVLSAHTTVLPLRLATLYADDAHVREMLGERRQTFTALLDRLADHVEWGVKIYTEPSNETAPSEPPVGGDLSAQSRPGRAYLQRRSDQRRAREDVWRAAEEMIRRIDAEARDLAVEHARHRLQQGRLAGGPGENVANDAYLVPRHLAEEFRDRVLRSTEGLPGLRVEVTGPWAPYSFAEPAAPDTREGAPPQ
ncbi:GvpL/GvpF family gas vesicle protein [Streptomyces kaniharaensis]|uniref:GvpL/GvpF family gas vesicle protein n=1 Tax=Streptomyces kaniharaensis TaxID=212423 RepID=A0A6N7KYY9_9ACTN|nr:GvpL/GvpF family gas vesicle protein [Streptomyces kaniharaensis]MQS16641.1 GvpL/GvpF family gas vesicle protein [Streptomyces kaniharaensis]